ncbi:MAG: FlgD immunoglobulin-like domain containing protein [Candidatus Krumholzibacteriia bacterium]
MIRAETARGGRAGRAALVLCLLGALGLPGAGIALAAAPGDEAWSADFYLPGLDDVPAACVDWRDGLVVGGAFRAAGPVAAEHIAFYDGAQWHALGEGLDGPVLGLAVWGEDVVACGEFTHAGGIAAAHVARWDGVAWHALGDGVPAGVRAVAAYGESLHCDRYRWDGAAWVDVLGTDGVVYDFCVFDERLVAGGTFTSTNGAPCGHVLAWDGTSVVDAYPGADAAISSLEVVGPLLYALRLVQYLPDFPPVLVWGGAAWTSLPAPTPATMYSCGALLSWQGQLFMPYKVSATPGPYWSSSILRWDGTEWRSWAGATWTEARWLHPWQDGLIVGGRFALWRTCAAANIVLLRAGVPESLTTGGQGVGDSQYQVFDVAAADSLAICGVFRAVGDVPCYGAAVWTAAGWSGRHTGSLGQGIWYSRAVAWGGGRLYSANGIFSDYTDECTAVWGANGWQLLWERLYSITPGGGLVDLLPWRGTLYAAGYDLYIASYATVLPTVADAIDGQVRALADWRDQLVAVGGFESLGGVPAHHVAAFDSTQWHTLDYPYAEEPLAATVWGDRLVVAGGRWNPNLGRIESRIDAWDGTTWQDLASGVGGQVLALCAVGPRLYAGGDFTSLGPEAAAGVARFDGTTWQALGSGVAGRVNALAVWDNRLWVAGRFARAGGKPAANVCFWRDTAVPVLLRAASAARLADGGVRVGWECAGPAAGAFRLTREAADGPTVELPLRAAPGQTSFVVDDAAAPATALTYRLWLGAAATGPLGELLRELQVAAAPVPDATALQRAVPNPFNPRGVLKFELARAGRARLAVYDVGGRLVARLVDAELPAGRHEAVWSGTDDSGRAVPSGTYVARLTADGRATSVKLSLVR